VKGTFSDAVVAPLKLSGVYYTRTHKNVKRKYKIVVGIVENMALLSLILKSKKNPAEAGSGLEA
jgi:hypothetical protein